MEYSVQFGSLKSKAKASDSTKRFRLAVIGDFSAKGNSGRVEVGNALASRKPLRVSHENLDELISRLDVRLKLPAGTSGSMMEIPITCMEDFHPDNLYRNNSLFEKLVGLRQKLQDPSTFPKAASAVQSLADSGQVSKVAPTARSSSTAVPRGRIESFADLIQLEGKVHETPELKTLLRDVVSSHIVSDMHGQAELIAAVDESLSDLMRRILHHPDFQAAESLWRSLDLVIHRLELDQELEVVLYDLNAAEFAADLASCSSLEETGLYKWLVEAPALDASQGPISMMVCNFVFEHIPPHAELLGRAAKIAAAANAPLIASVDCTFLKKMEPEDVHPLTKQAWQSLRELPESAYLGLTTPRFMLRWPYGKKTEPIESFKFEEFTIKSGLSGMLWGNSSFLAGLVIAQTYRDQGLASMKLGSVLTVDDIPFYFYNDSDGDQIALPCTERLVNVRTAQHVSSQGLIPVLSMQGRPEVRLGGLHSVAGNALAGPWAPVSINSSGELEPMEPVPMPTPLTPTAEALPPVVATDASDELDSLLASLDDTASAPAENGSDMDAELAALLADL